MYLELLKAVIYIFSMYRELNIDTAVDGHWERVWVVLDLSTSSWKIWDIHSCLLQTTLHVLSVVAEFGSLIEIKVRRTFLNVRNSVKAVHKPIAGFRMWKKSVWFRARHPWVARDSVLVVTGSNEVVKQHVGGTPLSPGDAQVTLVVVGTVVGVLEDLAHGGADYGRVGTGLPKLYNDTTGILSCNLI